MSNNQHLLLHLLIIANLAEFAFSVSNLLASRKYCGYQHSDDYNRENFRISIDEFPWIAQLMYDEDRRILCTGSLINNRYVLTAAHCIITPTVELVGVRLGDFNVTSDEDCVKSSAFDKECSDPVQEFEIEEKIPHPKFKKRSGLNDIALVRLSKPAAYSDYIRPICLPISEDVKLTDDQELAVSGWGTLGIGTEATEIKKKVLTTLVSYEKCRKLYNNSVMLVSPYHICASETNSFTCRGDSGGPLMLAINNQWEQVGILSFGRGCGNLYPTVYLNPAKYLNWIIQNLKA